MSWGALERVRLRLSSRLRYGPESFFLWTGRHMGLAFKLAVPVLVSTVVLVAVLGAVVTNQVTGQVETAFEAQASGVASAVDAMYMEHPYYTTEMNDYLVRIVQTRPGLVSIRIVGL